MSQNGPDLRFFELSLVKAPPASVYLCVFFNVLAFVEMAIRSSMVY